MRKYNVWRPIFLIAIALLTKSIVTNLCMLLGMEPATAENLGFMGMVIAAIIVFSRFEKRRRK